ncbi:hypothetical protein OG195_38060 [Streptomyces sp. NBC_01362]|uniref:hypothetical protein n=1 Tax=Streptomyces sp. NBC_01362 TaxID=2903839 RepID=UPI002E3409A4|nr:hypothetical protein [Streptomyces sp. NBC_01362]
MVGFLAARALLEAGVAVAQARVTPKIRTALECEFLTLTAHVRLEVVDDADWHDEAYRANDRGLFYARQIVGQVVSLAAALLGLVGTAGVLGVLHPALLPLLLLSVLPVGAAAVRNARARFHSFKRWNTLQRRVRVFSQLLLERDAAAELRPDTAQGALLEEHRRLTTQIAEEDTRLGVSSAALTLAGRAVGGIGTGITYTALGTVFPPHLPGDLRQVDRPGLQHATETAQFRPALRSQAIASTSTTRNDQAAECRPGGRTTSTTATFRAFAGGDPHVYVDASHMETRRGRRFALAVV